MNGSRETGEVPGWLGVAAVLVAVLAASALGALLLVPDGSTVPDGLGTSGSAARSSEAVAGGARTGATPTATPRPPRNPWRSDPIVVGIENRADRNRSYEPLVGAALDYWSVHGVDHGAYLANYSLRPNASDPEITVVFVPTIDRCGHRDAESVVGCAPKLDDDDYRPGGITVRIEGDLDDPSTVTTLKHEFGHTLGLSHGYNRTLAFMNASVTTRRRPMTDAVNKTNPWESASLGVYVNYTAAVDESEHAGYAVEIREGLAYWNDGAEGYAPPNLTLSLVENESAADVVVTFADSVDTADGTGYEVNSGGTDPDGDGRIETFTHATVTLSERGDTDLLDWSVAAAVGYLLGDIDPDERAPPFDGDVENMAEWTD